MRVTRVLILLTFLIAAPAFSQGGGEQNVVHIPNVFTPNGDGVNDIFRVDASGFEELTVSIFNRYGEVVYRYYGLNGSWDGHTHAGIKVSPGVYYVFVKVSSGGETQTDQETLQVQY